MRDASASGSAKAIITVSFSGPMRICSPSGRWVSRKPVTRSSTAGTEFYSGALRAPPSHAPREADHGILHSSQTGPGAVRPAGHVHAGVYGCLCHRQSDRRADLARCDAGHAPAGDRAIWIAPAVVAAVFAVPAAASDRRSGALVCLQYAGADPDRPEV